MAKIRTIKPDFWDSPAVGRASLRARLLYIAMWNWADDWGVGDAHPGRLISFAFPNDDLDPARIPQLFQEVSNLFRVHFFEHEGRPYYYITTWEKHQRIDKRSKQWVPIPDMADGTLFPQVSMGPPESPQNPTETPGDSAAGNRKREVGNRKSVSTVPDLFDTFYDTYPRKAKRGDAQKAWGQALDRSIDPQLMLDGAHRLANDPNLPTGDDRKYIPYPASWIRADGWLDEPLPARHSSSTPQHSTTDDRVNGWLQMSQNLASQNQDRLEIEQ